MTKIPKFFLKLIDAFIMRLPASLMVFSGALALSGVEDRYINYGLMTDKPFLWLAVLAFAAVWAFLYTAFGRTRTRGMHTLIVIAEIILTACVLTAIGNAIGRPQKIIPYLLSMNITQTLFLSWIPYMIVSEIVKAKNRKKLRRRRTASEDPTLQTFSQLTDVALTFSAMHPSRKSHAKGGAVRTSAVPKPQATSPSSRPADNTPKGSGAKTEGEFNNLLRQKGYDIFKLRNNVVLVIANGRVYILRYLKQEANYTVADGVWYKNGNPFDDITSEITFVEKKLKSQCGIKWVKAMLVKTFAGGKVPGSKELKYADVSENYNSAEAVILKQIPLNPPEKKYVSTTAQKVKAVFKDRSTSEGGDE